MDAWLEEYNRERPHSGRYCYGKTPWETFQASKRLAMEKDLSRGGDRSNSTVLRHTAVRQFPLLRFSLNFYTQLFKMEYPPWWPNPCSSRHSAVQFSNPFDSSRSMYCL